jgi:hypothetical protein
VRVERAVDRDLSWSDAQPLQFGDRAGQERLFGWVAKLGRRWQDQPTSVGLGVLSHLCQLLDEPELVRVAQLPLADGPGVRVEQRDVPFDDRLARDMLADLPGDLLTPIRPLLQAADGVQLRASATPRALRRVTAASRRASLTERSNRSPVCAVTSSTSALAPPERRRIVREIARSLRPIARERSRTRRLFSPISFARLRPSRASVLTLLERAALVSQDPVLRAYGVALSW